MSKIVKEDLMTEIEFRPFQKIPRLRREVIITEKIDGTNASIYIGENGEFLTGSRTRWITPENDNFGFSRWANDNKEKLVSLLGPGHHFGEWWGKGIQRNYGLLGRRFSLFNSERWSDITYKAAAVGVPSLDVVPVLYRGPADTAAVDAVLQALLDTGSLASPGFFNPEGIILFHTASNCLFKVTLEDDDHPKSVDRR